MTPRKPALEILDRLVGLGQATQHALQVGQASLFDLIPADAAPSLISFPDVPEADYREKLAWEKELLGVYLSEHPLQKMAERLKDHVSCLCGQVDAEMAGQKVILAGMVTDVRRIVTKKGDTMAFAMLEDVQGKVEVTIFPKTYKRTEAVWEADRILLVRGKVELRDERPQVVCDTAEEYGAEDRPTTAGGGDEALPAILVEKPAANGHDRANGNGRWARQGPPCRPRPRATMCTSRSPGSRTPSLPDSACSPSTRS